jgi:hypothetical protein
MGQVGAHGVEQKCIYFGRLTLKGSHRLENVGIHGRIILKSIVCKHVYRINSN